MRVRAEAAWAGEKEDDLRLETPLPFHPEEKLLLPPSPIGTNYPFLIFSL